MASGWASRGRRSIFVCVDRKESGYSWLLGDARDECSRRKCVGLDDLRARDLDCAAQVGLDGGPKSL